MANSVIFKSSIGKKFFMALTGLFLITFLIVHAGINSMIWFNDGGETFTFYAHFMGTNLIIRTIEIVLVAGFIIHIVDGLLLWKQNREARPVKYAYNNPSANSSWYSRSMGLLGTLILIFLVIHTSNFWIPNRSSQLLHGEELNLFAMMQAEFSHWYMVLIYIAGCFSLFWHLFHGFRSAFQSLGLNHTRYNKTIGYIGYGFSIIISIAFAMMPISMFFGWVQ